MKSDPTNVVPDSSYHMHEIPNAVQVLKHSPELPTFVELQNQKCKVGTYLSGAHVFKFEVSDTDILWMSDKSSLIDGEPKRGGIPLVLFHFATPEVARRISDHKVQLWDARNLMHGFARISTSWQIDSTAHNPVTDEASVTFRHPIVETTDGRKAGISYVVTLKGTTLSTSLHVENCGLCDINFQALFHNYFAKQRDAIPLVMGAGTSAIDRMQQDWPQEQVKEVFLMSGAMDRVFVKPSKEIDITGSAWPIRLTTDAAADLVLWRPTKDFHSKQKDFPEGGEKEMFCVEPGNLRNPISLRPSEKWRMTQSIRVFSTK